MGLFGGIFAGLVEDSNWCDMVRSSPYFGGLQPIRDEYKDGFRLSEAIGEEQADPSNNFQLIISGRVENSFGPALKEFNKLPRPKSTVANKIRKDLLVGIEAHLWATKDGKKYIDREINTGRSDGGLLKEYNKWAKEGYLRLGRALEYIETH